MSDLALCPGSYKLVSEVNAEGRLVPSMCGILVIY